MFYSAGFRNILVHRYFKVDSGIVYENLRDCLDDFEAFMRFLRRKNPFLPEKLDDFPVVAGLCQAGVNEDVEAST